jgi:hypothetical protein
VIEVVFLGDSATPVGFDRELAELRLLRREFPVGGGGAVDIDPLPGLSWVWAEAEGLVSEPWIGKAPATIELAVGPRFTARGWVRREAGVDLGPDTSIRVSIRRGSSERVLERSQVRDDGSWGPSSVPLVAGDAYVFRLDGADLIPTEKVVEPPRGFADVQIDFTAQIGFTLPVVAVGAEDEVIPGVRVAAKWLDEASWTSRDASTDEHGRASLRGLPPAVIYLWASRDGFVDMGADPLELSASRVEPVLIRLSPAGTIRGRCVRGDVPVTSFELIWWKEQGTASAHDGGGQRDWRGNR